MKRVLNDEIFNPPLQLLDNGHPQQVQPTAECRVSGRAQLEAAGVERGAIHHTAGLVEGMKALRHGVQVVSQQVWRQTLRGELNGFLRSAQKSKPVACDGG